MKHLLAHFLFFMAAWTLVIKFLFPMAYSVAYDQVLAEHIFWDFWWVVHIALGWALLRPPMTSIAWFAVVTAAAEIVIVAGKFYFFLSEPEWTIWRTNWFINKVFVLALFLMLMVDLIRNWDDYSGHDGSGGSGGRPRGTG